MAAGRFFGAMLFAACVLAPSLAHAADACPDASQDIDADRPDVTNSSLVVPTGSLQFENGIDWSDQHGPTQLSASNTRIRLGTDHCWELLVDLPDYQSALTGHGPAGFSNIAPAIKHQFNGLPEGLTLSAVAGIALPTGAFAISGGVSPYLQTSWSRELGEGWSLNSMQTATWYPDQPAGTANFETTLSLERDITPRADAFVEYVGDYHTLGIAGHVFDLGGAYHLTALQQVDFHAGLGLNRASPHFYIGLGYSFRLDHLTRDETQF